MGTTFAFTNKHYLYKTFMKLFEHKPDTVINIEGDLIINLVEEMPHRHRRVSPKLAFNILINNTNLKFMSVVKSLALTSAAPVQLFMTVIDENKSHGDFRRSCRVEPYYLIVVC